jgi:hypothetical protein
MGREIAVAKLVPIKSTTMAAMDQPNAVPSVITANTLPHNVMRGIVDLLLSFPAGRPLSTDEHARVLQLYGEALFDTETVIAEYALQRLRRFNPRNPFPPTPQDLFQECNRIRRLWRSRVIDHLIMGQQWDDEPLNAGKRDPWGPPPLTEGCWVPHDSVLSALRAGIQSGRYETYLLIMTDADFERLPDEAFDPGKRDEFVERRRERAEREKHERAQAARRQWIIDLGQPLTQEFLWAEKIAQGLRETLSDDVLLERAKASVKRGNVEPRRCVGS